MEPVIDSTNYKSFLSKYSNLVTATMRSNKSLEAKVSNRQQILSQLKSLLKKFSSLGTKDNSVFDLKQDLLLLNEAYRQKNKKLLADIANLQQKKQQMTTQFSQSNEEMKQKIDKEKDFNFIIANVLLEKEAISQRIRQSFRQIEKSDLRRLNEEDRELSPEEAFEFYCDDIDNIRTSLYHESRAVNRHFNQKTKLMKLIATLKAELSTSQGINCLSERKISRNALSERRAYCDNKTIPDQSNLEDSYLNDTSYFDDINLDSDEDNNFEANNFAETVKLDKDSIKKVIPYLNLKQILFNKEKQHPEIDENSIERRNRLESIADEIDEINEKIKLMKKVVRNNKKMELNYTVNINKMNKYLADKSKRKTLISS